MDTEVKQFLQQILVVDEEVRPSIEDIVSDPFLAELNLPVKQSPVADVGDLVSPLICERA